MARKKTKKSKKTLRRNSKRSIFSNQKSSDLKENKFSVAKLLLNLLLTAVVIFGIYVIWTLDWFQGVMIIFVALVVYLLIKLIANLRKKS
ncbi:hypothetical protein COU56_01155 [Candidatus Pacearchaeota archaeon CG10_big_fil_rev_8_21_14_0_10_31_9]|nr:MAG: hypothetical protein COU56_01155 [Candidatus Pacearchaeota archaeon CG10_big_fil_rev_8_21_14_0_10_31_9]